jgi:hypothetical protein
MRHLALFLVLIAPAAGAHRWSDRSSERRSELRDHASTQRGAWDYGGTYQPAVAGHRLGYCGTCDRDARGWILHNPAVRRAFQGSHPCSATGLPTGPCPGYVVDHLLPLKRGGADDPSNMQWQTIEEAKAKDKIE